jgi:parvulin-like peptidyl-prolyl isomerase
MLADSALPKIRRRASAALAASLLVAGAAQAESYGVVLRVNERIATTYDYQMRLTQRLQAVQGAESLTPERRQRMLAEAPVATMNEIFEELLILSRADQLGLDVSEAEIDRAVARTKDNLGIKTQEQFEQALQVSNMTVETLRQSMAKSLLVQKVMGEEVQPKIKLEEEDLRRYYQNHSEDFQEPERLHLREVVFLDSSDLSPGERTRQAEEVRRELASGRELAEVIDPLVQQGVASSAVDLGWVELGDLDRDLEEAVWSLETGGVSEPVAGRGGLHVLLVEERQEARLRTFNEVEEEIRATESERLFSDEMQKYVEELESRAYIVAKPPPEAAGFRASLSTVAGEDDLDQALTAPLISEPIEMPRESPAEEPDVGADSGPPVQD